MMFSIANHRLVKFLSGFAGMKDLLLSVTKDGISGAGTCERSFFIKKWINFQEDEGITQGDAGSIPIGQLTLFKSLLAGCGNGNVEITYNGGNIIAMGEEMNFQIPPTADPTSQAGVDIMEGMLDAQPNDPLNWTSFGEAAFDFNLGFSAEEVRSLRDVGKAIQAGALYTLEVDQTHLQFKVSRDQIDVQKNLSYGEWSNSPETVTITFGRWLMDALLAMPSAGNIYFVGGNDSPLI